MRQVLFVLMAVLAFGLHGGIGDAQQQSGKGTVYNSNVVYAGEYNADELLFKNRPTDPVWHSIPKINRLSKITCPDALAQLKREGTWQGHLNLDGSCGPTGEPAVWSLGNRLNHDAPLEQ